MTSPSTTRAVAFLESYLLHDGETQQRLNDLKELARAERVPWSAVETASRKLGVVKVQEPCDGRFFRYWKLPQAGLVC